MMNKQKTSDAPSDMQLIQTEQSNMLRITQRVHDVLDVDDIMDKYDKDEKSKQSN